MKPIYAFLIFVLAFSACADAATCEASWIQYKDELCIKTFTSFLPYDEAKDFCISQGNDLSQSSLVMVKEAELQDALANHTHDLFDNIWLGGKFDNISSQYMWEDGEPLTYTNWQDGYPSNATDSEHCIELRPKNTKQSIKTDGKWADVVCQKRNMVMCQRTLTWSLQDAINEIIRMRKKHEEDLDNVYRELQTVSDRVVPVGSIYVEYFNQPSPVTLWPALPWEDITSTYAGLFFRALGGDSANWGNTQDACTPRITEMDYSEHHIERGERPLSIPSNGYSEFGYSGYHHPDGPEGVDFERLRILTEGCEVRPKSQAVRVWKRIA